MEMWCHSLINLMYTGNATKNTIAAQSLFFTLHDKNTLFSRIHGIKCDMM